MIRINITQAKNHLARYLRHVEKNRETIILCRRNVPIAEISPINHAYEKRSARTSVRMWPREAVYVSVLLVGLAGGRANGQIYPDPRMTKVFESRLEAFAKSHTRVFVSDCNLSRVGDEKAIFTMPVGSSSGTLVLLIHGDVYNGSGVTYDANGAVLVDPGGGEWSQRRLQDIANQLTNLRFALMQPQDVARLISEPSSHNCVEPAK